MRHLFITLLFLLPGVAHGQLTTVTNIGIKTVPVGVPARYTGIFPAGRTLDIDSTYTASIFHIGGLVKPRFMAFSSAGVLHVSDMSAGKVFALPDVNNDGVADTMITAANGFSNNHDVKFYKGAMYVTEPTRIWKCVDTDGDGVYETKTIFISDIGNNETTGHVTRTVVFDSINQKVYVSVGSSCNVCRENHRAIIEQYNEDGSGRRVFASGTRNAVGMAMHPVTNRLWANNNGSDAQGNETPPEWIDIVRDGGFYGHPFAYGPGSWFDFSVSGYNALLPITPADSANVAQMVPPAALIRAHSAPMALEFLNSGFGAGKQYGFLSALRGSWNSPASFRGYKVIYAHLSSDIDTTVDYVADFCTGFITDTISRIYWGRPVGLAIGSDGKVFISSDESSKCILVLTPRPTTTGVHTASRNTVVGKLFPNPTVGDFTLPLTLPGSTRVTVKVYDLAGRAVRILIDQALPAGNCAQKLSLRGLSGGSYIVKINAGGGESTQMLQLKD